MVSRTTLDGECNDLAGLFVRFFLRLLFNVLDHLSRLMTNFLFYVGQYDTACVFHREIGDSFKLRHLVFVDHFDLLLCFIDTFLFVSHLLFFTFE
ncbi:hypothetical protein D3C75_1158320 [compost metagenome]